MSFETGKVSFKIFGVTGQASTAVDEPILEKVREHLFKVQEFGTPEEVEYGWTGPRHLFDAEISFDNCVYANCLHLNLRIDTNKVPGARRKALQAQEEAALAKNNPSGFISKNQKREAKDTVERSLEQEIKDGKHRRSRLVPVLWNLETAHVYTNASGATLEKLNEIMERTFGVELQGRSAGELAAIYCNRDNVGSKVFDDLRPTRFVRGPEGDGQVPDYPWVAKGSEPKNFLGNEFLLYLWYMSDAKSGAVTTQNGKDITIFIDRSLELDCAYGQTGRETLRGDGPSRSQEAKTGLRMGKVPRKAYFIIDHEREQYGLTLNPESMTFSSVGLPEVEEAESPRVLFEERIASIARFRGTISTLFSTFMQARVDTQMWGNIVTSIQQWINKEIPQCNS
jgi:hypothetical protein